MSNTIMYTIDRAVADNPSYTYQILTLGTAFNGSAADFNLSIPSLPLVKGIAGHVLLTYPSGGTMLTSCGHWLELSKLDVSLDSLLNCATSNWGEAYTNEIRAAINATPVQQQAAMVQQYANQFVQQASPCLYSTPNWNNKG